MVRSLGFAAVAIALSACATPTPDAPPPRSTAAQPAQGACGLPPLTLADGRRVQPTCSTYRQCTLFKPVAPPGSRTTGLPFFVMANGRPTSEYPGPGNCL